MEPFTHVQGVAAPIDMAGVNTDQIFPARFLRKPRAVGYAQFAFHDIRRDGDGAFRDDFALNQPKFEGATFLVAGPNFGCGSSREGAVYTLYDSGIRALIAPSFGDIFAANCLKNGVLTVRLDAAVIGDLTAWLGDAPDPSLAIDLDRQTVTPAGRDPIPFDIDPFNKHCLMNALNEIDLSLEFGADMDAFEANRRAAQPWLTPAS